MEGSVIYFSLFLEQKREAEHKYIPFSIKDYEVVS